MRADHRDSLRGVIRLRTLREIAHRSMWDARDRVWRDVELWLVVTALTAALLAWHRTAWAATTIFTVLALGVVLAAAFVRDFVRNVRHPDRNDAWCRDRSWVLTEREVQAPASLTCTLLATRPTYTGRYVAEVTDPHGYRWREWMPPGEPAPRLIKGLQLPYPASFPGAPPLESGTYRVRWLAGTSRGCWRELLRYDEVVAHGVERPPNVNGAEDSPTAVVAPEPPDQVPTGSGPSAGVGDAATRKKR